MSPGGEESWKQNAFTLYPIYRRREAAADAPAEPVPTMITSKLPFVRRVHQLHMSFIILPFLIQWSLGGV